MTSYNSTNDIASFYWRLNLTISPICAKWPDKVVCKNSKDFFRNMSVHLQSF